MALLLKANGVCKEVTPANGKTWTLQELQAFVGGYIEIAYPRVHLDEQVLHAGDDGMILVVDEEGLLKEKPLNLVATRLYDVSLIVGDVLYCKSEEVE